MALASALLAVFAAVSFAVYTIILERAMGRVRRRADVSPILGAAFLSTLVAFVIFWTLVAVRGLPADGMTVGNVAPFVVAGVSYPALFRLLFYEGIDRVGAGVTAAIAGAYPAVAAVLAVWTLEETLTLAGGIGILLVVIGVGVLQLTQGGEDEPVDLEDVLSTRLAAARPIDLLFPVGATVAVAAGVVLIKYGLDRFPDPVTATAITQTPALLLFAGWVAASQDRAAQFRIDRLVLAAYVFSGVFIVAGWLGQFYALRIGRVVAVVPVLNAYPLVVVAITYALARQVPRSPRVLSAIAAIIVGATLAQVF